MPAGDFFTAYSADVASGSDFIVDGSTGGTGAVTVQSIAYGGDCDVFLEIDSAGDSSWAVSIPVDSFTGPGYSQQNKIELNSADNMRLRINNTSGGAADFAVTGVEIFA
jgi:hypothetical protein